MGLLFLASGLLTGCEKKVQRADVRRLEVEFLLAAVPEALLEYSHLELAAKDAVQRVEEDGHSGLAHTLDPAHRMVNRGNRADVSVDYPYAEGATIRYDWEFTFP